MGFHQRSPYDLSAWLEPPDALLGHLRRMDAACAALLAERTRIKKERSK